MRKKTTMTEINILRREAETGWKQKLSWQFQDYVSQYYLKNKNEPIALRTPSIGEIIDWWLNKIESIIKP